MIGSISFSKIFGGLCLRFVFWEHILAKTLGGRCLRFVFWEHPFSPRSQGDGACDLSFGSTENLRSSACFPSRLPKMEVSGVGVLYFEGGSCYRKRRKEHPHFGYMQHHSLLLFPLAQRTTGRQQWKKGLLSFKIPKSESLVWVSFSRRVSLQKKEEKDTRNTQKILDALLYTLS